MCDLRWAPCVLLKVCWAGQGAGASQLLLPTCALLLCMQAASLLTWS